MFSALKQLFIVVCGICIASCSTTPGNQNLDVKLRQKFVAAPPVAFVESTASASFRLLMEEIEICRDIMLNDDWSGVEGREDVTNDADKPVKYLSIRQRALVANNGLTQIVLTDIPQSAEDDGPLIFCRSMTLQPLTTQERIALQIEFDQWVDKVNGFHGRKEILLDAAGPLQAGAAWCESEKPVAIIVPLGRELQPEGFAISLTTGQPVGTLSKGFVCPVNPDAILKQKNRTISKRVTNFFETHLIPDASVTLDHCNLSIVRETVSKQKNTALPLTRVVQSADLSMYSLDDIGIISEKSGPVLQIQRKSVNERMIDQAQMVFKGAVELGLSDLTDRDIIRETLRGVSNKLFVRMTQEAGVESNIFTLNRQEDTAAFYKYSQRMEALPRPSSYRSKTYYSKRKPSARTLMSGQIVAVPPLQFSTYSVAQAENIAGGLIEYAREKNCL